MALFESDFGFEGKISKRRIRNILKKRRIKSQITDLTKYSDSEKGDFVEIFDCGAHTRP